MWESTDERKRERTEKHEKSGNKKAQTRETRDSRGDFHIRYLISLPLCCTFLSSSTAGDQSSSLI